MKKDACLAFHGKSAPFPIFYGQLASFVSYQLNTPGTLCEKDSSSKE